MHAIHAFGSDEQRQHYLPKLRTGEFIGCFCLTEPNHGSDPAGIETQVIEKEGQLFLNGHKKWIGLSPVADIFIVWAKNHTGRVHGYLVEKNDVGISIETIKNKLSLRAGIVGEIIFKDVKILQRFLAKDKKIYPERLVTGYFGVLTKAAVANFLPLKFATSTIHVVTEEADFGPILKRVFVRVEPDDSVKTLYAKLKLAEHEGLIEVLRNPPL